MAARRKPGSELAGLWEFPGGKVEPGETEQECLSRELREEFGVDSRVGAFVAESIYHYPTKVIRLRAYRVAFGDGPLRLNDHDRICWLPVEELHRLSWAPADLPILQSVREDEWLSATLAYYRENSAMYFRETLPNIAQLPLLRRFVELLPSHGHVLDLGCGSGRDSRFLLDRGFRVTAVDASPEMAGLAAEYLKHPVRVQRAENLGEINKYDGIWTCAGLVHIPKSLMGMTFSRILCALKPGGIWFTSFKSGETEKVDDIRRPFNNYSRPAIVQLLDNFSEATICDIYESTSLLRAKKQQWLNVFVTKNIG